MMPRTILNCAVISLLCVLVVTLGCRGSTQGPTGSKVEPAERIPAGTAPALQEPPVQRATEVKPEEKKPTVQLALKFTPQDSTTYKVIVEADRSVKWEGPLPEKPAGFIGGHTGNRIELTFAQRIQSVNDKGNAVAEIEIKTLKCLAKVKDNVVLEFDSSREKNKDNLLTKLIGQRYAIELSPAGQVLQVVDANQARAAIEAGSSAYETASALLSPAAIKQRHTIPALPPAEKSRLSSGDSWSSVTTFSFDMMGAKSYEKIYTLKEIKEADNRQLAIVDMNAVPSSQLAQELRQEQATNPLEKMFDTAETYSGQLKLDLTAGKVQKCLEQLRIEWVIVDPQPKDEKAPAALRMAATRLYSIEKID